MSWITAVGGPTPLEEVLGQRPELLMRYRSFYRTLWQEDRVPRRMLELTRLRIAAIHDCEAEWVVRDGAVALGEAELAALRRGDFAAFCPAEQAALTVAEQIPYAHHHIADAEVEALATLLDAPGAVALITALAFFDATCRLKLVLGLPARACRLDTPPLWRDALV